MAIDAVLVGTRGTTASSTVNTVAGTSSASGSTFAIFVSYDSGATSNTPTDSKSNTYVKKGTTVTGGAKLELWVCENGTGGASHSAQVTFVGGTNSFATAHLIEITGAAAASFDVTSQGVDTGTPFTLTSPTLNQANEVVLCAVEANTGGTGSYASSNFTVLSEEPNNASFWTSAVAKLVVSATTAVTPSFTRVNDTSTSAAMILGTFKEAVAGGNISITPTAGALSLSGPTGKMDLGITPRTTLRGT